MNATQIGIFFTGKAKINLMDNTNIKIGKIRQKRGFKPLRKGNNHYYILRIVDSEAVDATSTPLKIWKQRSKNKNLTIG